MERNVVAGLDDQGRRLDRVLRKLLPTLPLSAVYRLVRSGDVRVNGKKTKPDYLLAAGDELRLWITDGAPAPDRGDAPTNDRGDAPTNDRGDAPTNEGGAEAGEADERERAELFSSLILVETADLVVVNKPRGLLSHGEGGLDTLALAYFAGRSRASLAFTPAPLHRLDRNTSGALAVSASIRGAREFSRALRAGLVRKSYLALLDGELPGAREWRDALRRDEGELKSAQGSGEDRQAHALFEPLAVAGGKTLARIRIYTGLTHQIRAQAALRGYPLSGDAKYGGSPLRGGYLLHSLSLSIPQDLAAESPGTVLAPLPEAARRALETIFGVKALNRSFE